jgi:hypothetical protein
MKTMWQNAKKRGTINRRCQVIYPPYVFQEFFQWAMFAIFFCLCYINNMDFPYEERIGNPDLFTGRKSELAYFLKWINDIKERKSQSTAIMARRKMGKTALLERLFNITFFKNDGVIPFYYEIKENDVWVLDFCQDFFLTFVYQYISCKSRKKEYLNPETRSDFARAVEIAKQEGLSYLCGIIEDAAHAVAQEKIDILWNIAREAPKTIAARQEEYIVQMIDEFQFMNAMIYWDREDLGSGDLCIHISSRPVIAKEFNKENQKAGVLMPFDRITSDFNGAGCMKQIPMAVRI